ncbi:MAG: hypothetical protein HUU50_18645 [Candidatus Brocadiae bacterium]|nr:hypothetical protein [Candidatus Brocadiia bacterium]
MYTLYFVIFNKEVANTSHEARSHAKKILLKENFVDEGYFGSGKAEAFIIGGGYSGILTKTLHDLDIKEGRKKADLKFLDPYKRDKYPKLGYEDDAAIITHKLFHALQKKYSEVEAFDSDNCLEATLDDFRGKEMIGRWIVVINYF